VSQATTTPSTRLTFSQNPKGRLTAVRYYGGYNSGSSPTYDTTFTEMMSYGTPGNITSKRVRVKRASRNNLDLDSTYTYDTEGRTRSSEGR
jgi:hypothetical protein